MNRKIKWLIPNIQGKKRNKGKFIKTSYNTSSIIKNGILYGIDLNYYENAIETEYVMIVKGTMAKQVCTY